MSNIVKNLRFKDHHWYDAGDVETIERAAKQAGAAHIVSTEKDGVRLACVPGLPGNILLLEMELELLD